MPGASAARSGWLRRVAWGYLTLKQCAMQLFAPLCRFFRDFSLREGHESGLWRPDFGENRPNRQFWPSGAVFGAVCGQRGPATAPSILGGCAKLVPGSRTLSRRAARRQPRFSICGRHLTAAVGCRRPAGALSRLRHAARLKVQGAAGGRKHRFRESVPGYPCWVSFES